MAKSDLSRTTPDTKKVPPTGQPTRPGETDDPEATEKRADDQVQKLHEDAGQPKTHGGGSPGNTPQPKEP